MTVRTDILFVHQNFPAQYKPLATKLAQQPDFRVFAIGSGTNTPPDGVQLQHYAMPRQQPSTAHPFAQRLDIESRRGEQVMYAANKLKAGGISPRIIFVHPGWGDAIPLREIFPDARLVVYCEFYYRTAGADVGFDREFKSFGVDGLVRINLRNASNLLALVDADVAVAPTPWQRNLFPTAFQDKIHVIHDGIDTDRLRPQPATFTHPAVGQTLRTGDEVVTFVARNLEPYRGFHIFMRALPRILAARPQARVCIVGGSSVSYGSRPPEGENWKDFMLAEMGHQLDLSRVHFLGNLSYNQYLALMRVSRVHTYLTYPFVLSWSLIEALSLGCAVVASDTPPVRDAITDGDNGLLVPFFETEALAERVISVLEDPDRYASIRQRARQDAITRYDFERVIFDRHLALIETLRLAT